MRRVSGAAALALLCILGSCGDGGKPADAPRLIVLGIDAMDPDIVQMLLDAGRMPNIKALAERGGLTTLDTSMPPQSPVAWSAFITGMDPEGHGIYDFIHRDPQTMEPFLSTSSKNEDGEMVLLRHGTPFWEVLAAHGVPCVIFKVPSNFPPTIIGDHACDCLRAFSGMGTPDILGTYGTFTFFTEGSYTVPPHMEAGGTPLVPGGELDIPGGRVVSLDLREGNTQLSISGPQVDHHRYSAVADFSVDRGSGAAELVLDDQRVFVVVGEWTRWLEVDYGRKPGSLERLTGIVRFYLRQVDPEVQLYMSPVNIDPSNPAMPISYPEEAAAALSEDLGPYYTQGMPDDTKALEAEVFDYDDFLIQDSLTYRERVQQLEYELERFDSGLLFFYVHTLDQVQHMLWRTIDPEHPGYRPEFERFRTVIESRYEEMDVLLGEVLESVGPDAEVLVISDHGFAPFARAFNLNRWLATEGYLVLEPDASPVPQLLNEGDVRWRETRAYGLGLNALYVNLKGREKTGVVDPEERNALLDGIAADLLAVRDPGNGKAPVRAVFRPDHAAAVDPAVAPDLLIGYASGYRCSGRGAIGEFEEHILRDNESAWSGDHCMAPQEVPGIIVSSRPIGISAPHLRDIPKTILDFYGIEVPPAMIGHNVWGEDGGTETVSHR